VIEETLERGALVQHVSEGAANEASLPLDLGVLELGPREEGAHVRGAVQLPERAPARGALLGPSLLVLEESVDAIERLARGLALRDRGLVEVPARMRPAADLDADRTVALDRVGLGRLAVEQVVDALGVGLDEARKSGAPAASVGLNRRREERAPRASCRIRVAEAWVQTGAEGCAKRGYGRDCSASSTRWSTR